MKHAHHKLFITITACFALLVLTASCAWAAAGAGGTMSPGIMQEIINTYQREASAWVPTLQQAALLIFRWMLIIEVCFLGIKAALNRTQVGDIFTQFIMMTLFAGFMFAVIRYYPEWSKQIISGLQKLAAEAGGHPVLTTSPFDTGLNIAGKLLDAVSGWDPVDSLGYLISAVIIIITFALITAQVILITCEAYLAMAAGIVLLGFGASSITKDYAINVLRYTLAVAFKLMTMSLLLGVGLSIVNGFETTTTAYTDIIVIIGASIVLLALAKSLPDAVAGIINGSHVSSGMALTSAAGAVGGAVAGIAAGGAMAAGRGAMQIKDAANLASLEGKTGLGKAANMASTLWGNRQQAKSEIGMGSGNTGTRSRELMKDRLETARKAQTGGDSAKSGE